MSALSHSSVAMLNEAFDMEEIHEASSVSHNDPFEVRVASTTEEMMQAMAIRSAVYIGEQQSPYFEEFDGNDFSATHVLCVRDGEPVGTLRIRYFADFAKPERLAILRRYRGGGAADIIVRFAIDLCSRKGYRKLYGHAQKRLLPFWGKFGFRPMADGEFHFSDHEYVAIECDLLPRSDRLTLNSGHLKLIRPEGRWDAPGVHDRSTERLPTNPTS